MKTFEKRHNTDLVYWVIDNESIGTMEFSFDKKKIYNFYRDYPQKLSVAEIAIFNKENPILADLAAQ